MDAVEPPALNVAAIDFAVDLLGPGLRGVVWVQGCPFRCQGCVSPDWIPDRPASAHAPEELAAVLLESPEVAGVTFSGGEPMLQAPGLAATIREARARRACSLVCFTGFQLKELLRHPHNSGVPLLLSEVDVLIDGAYIAALNTGKGLRGSDNQRVHHLTDRLRGSGYDFEGRRREAEVRISPEGLRLVGVPPQGLTEAVAAVEELIEKGRPRHERTREADAVDRRAIPGHGQ